MESLNVQQFKNHTVFSDLNTIKLRESLCGFIGKLVFASLLYTLFDKRQLN